MFKIERTKTFAKQYGKLPKKIRDKVDKQLDFLIENPQHPSLSSKKMVNSEYWECRVDYHYRIVFRWQDDTLIILMFVGTHQIYRKAA
jgi:mRNA-degrading endonuclease RelE of RelBE toxin-antitoxin system